MMEYILYGALLLSLYIKHYLYVWEIDRERTIFWCSNIKGKESHKSAINIKIIEKRGE